MDTSKSLLSRPIGAVSCVLALVVFVVALATAPAHAETYPSKPIVMTLGYPPGGGNDTVARIIAPKLSEKLGVPVVLQYKSGADGTIGTADVTNASPDGYTLLFISSSPILIAPHYYPKLQYDPLKDLVPINTVGENPEALVVNPSVKAADLRALVDLSKKKEVRISSSGGGGLPHFAVMLLKQLSNGGQISFIPYRGGPQAITDTIGGHVDGVILDLPALMPFIQNRQLKPLAVAAPERSPFLPDVGTTGEQGFPDLLAVNWIGLFAPAGTPSKIVEKLNKALTEVAAMDETKEQMARVGVIPSTKPSPSAFRAFLESEYEKWGRIARTSVASKE